MVPPPEPTTLVAPALENAANPYPEVGKACIWVQSLPLP